jgi:hypothetical protein
MPETGGLASQIVFSVILRYAIFIPINVLSEASQETARHLI